MERSLAIIPVGSIPRGLCREVGTHLQEVLALPFEVLVGLGEPKYAYNAGQKQYHAAAIVRRVGQAISPRKHLLGLGLVRVDLFMPDVNFVFGDADRAQRAALVSLARFEPSRYGRPPDHALVVGRLLNEALYEIGHVLGLPGCNNEACAMFVANTLSDTDRKAGRFCDSCSSKLQAYTQQPS